MMVNSYGNEMVSSTFTIEDCVFENNSAEEGGAVFHNAVLHNIDLLYENCIFNNNVASKNGGAIINEVLSGSCTNMYKNCQFYNNAAISIGGVISNQGDVENNTVSNDFLNCIFYDNDANIGPCIYNIGGAGAVNNCTFYLNRTPAIGGYNNSIAVSNSIFWGPSDGNAVSTTGNVSGNIIKGGSGSGNLDVDPLFINETSKNFRVKPCSPAIDAGLNGNLSEVDLDEQNRIYNNIVDIGAYEFNASNLGLTLLEEPGMILPATHNYIAPDGWRHFYNCD